MFAFKTTFLVAILATFSTAAVAESYHVSIWRGLADCTGALTCLFDADQADIPVPAGTALATFDFVPTDPNTGIAWATSSNFNTYGDFLDGGQVTGFSSTLGLSSFLSLANERGGNRFASYFAITGLYDAPGNFSRSIMHDDGASLYVDGGNIFKAPSRVTGQATSGPYQFQGGTHNFGLYYVAADGGPAVLNFDVPNAASVPEPGSVALLGLGLAALGFAGWRRAA